MKHWNPSKIASIKFVLNGSYTRETNTNACNLTFGDIDQTIELLPPHADAATGERKVVGGLTVNASAAKQIQKGKVWECVNADVHTDESAIGCWKDKQLLTSAGACNVESLQNNVIGWGIKYINIDIDISK